MEDQHAPDILELDDGQLALSSDVVEGNGQQAFPEIAAPAKPAPLTFERDATEQAAREELDSGSSQVRQ